MARKLRLGLIGTGLASRQLYLPAFRELGHRIDLVACANRTRAKAEAYAQEAGVGRVHDTAEQVIADPDVEALMISLPIDQQPHYVLAALEAGKAVMSEKPNAANAAAGKRLLAAAAKYDVPYLVGENYAFMSHAHQMARWIAQGRLGEIRLAEVHQLTVMDASVSYFNTSWRAAPAHVGGFVADGGVHAANLLRRFMGDPVTVKSLTAQFSPDLPPVDTTVAALLFASGALGTWTSCFTAQPDGPIVQVYGAKANAAWYPEYAELTTRNGTVSRADQKEDSFTAQFRHFADVVVKGTPMAVTPAETLGDLQLIERILRGR